MRRRKPKLPDGRDLGDALNCLASHFAATSLPTESRFRVSENCSRHYAYNGRPSEKAQVILAVTVLTGASGGGNANDFGDTATSNRVWWCIVSKLVQRVCHSIGQTATQTEGTISAAQRRFIRTRPAKSEISGPKLRYYEQFSVVFCDLPPRAADPAATPESSGRRPRELGQPRA